MPQDVSSVMGKSLKTSSRPLELGVVGVVGVVGGVDGTLNSFRLSGPFFSWLLVLFFILVDKRALIHLAQQRHFAASRSLWPQSLNARFRSTSAVLAALGIAFLPSAPTSQLLVPLTRLLLDFCHGHVFSMFQYRAVEVDRASDPIFTTQSWRCVVDLYLKILHTIRLEISTGFHSHGKHYCTRGP